MRVPLALYGAMLCVCLVPILSAQDAVKVDPKHYTVISENDQVRILKVHYGPHEKSVMHSHPATVAVFLTDAKGEFSFPGGKKESFDVKAGGTQYTAAETHLPGKHRRQGDGSDRDRTEGQGGPSSENGDEVVSGRSPALISRLCQSSE